MLELQIKDLCVGYNGKEILHNISLDIENGSFIAIVGPSGAGKSTLLKQMALFKYFSNSVLSTYIS